jgi:hypothetical protein
MKQSFRTSLILAVLFTSSCTSSPAPPLDVGDRLVVPADHSFVVPPQGIRFSNGATIGVQPEQ